MNSSRKKWGDVGRSSRIGERWERPQEVRCEWSMGGEKGWRRGDRRELGRGRSRSGAVVVVVELGECGVWGEMRWRRGGKEGEWEGRRGVAGGREEKGRQGGDVWVWCRWVAEVK